MVADIAAFSVCVFEFASLNSSLDRIMVLTETAAVDLARTREGMSKYTHTVRLCIELNSLHAVLKTAATNDSPIV